MVKIIVKLLLSCWCLKCSVNKAGMLWYGMVPCLKHNEEEVGKDFEWMTSLKAGSAQFDELTSTSKMQLMLQ